MNEFVGTVPFLIIILGFDMKTMHFHIAQTGLFLGQFSTHENCLGMQGRSNKLPDKFCFCGNIIWRGLYNRNCCFW